MGLKCDYVQEEQIGSIPAARSGGGGWSLDGKVGTTAIIDCLPCALIPVDPPPQQLDWGNQLVGTSLDVQVFRK